MNQTFIRLQQSSGSVDVQPWVQYVTTCILTVAITNGNRANKSSGIPHHRTLWNTGRTARATLYWDTKLTDKSSDTCCNLRECFWQGSTVWCRLTATYLSLLPSSSPTLNLPY